MTKQDNRVEVVHERIVEVTVSGKQDRKSVIRVGEQAAEAVAQTPEQLILVDLRGYVRANTLEVRRAVFETFSNVRYRKMALYGGDRLSANLISLIARATKRRDSIRHFASRNEAIAWLTV